MKETVEQAAKDYADGLRRVDKKNTYDNIEVDSVRMVAFKRGAEWQSNQSPWISVEDKLPPMAEHVILKKGTFYVGFGFFGENMIFHSITIGDNSLVPNTVSFTHWMPIPEQL